MKRYKIPVAILVVLALLSAGLPFFDLDSAHRKYSEIWGFHFVIHYFDVSKYKIAAVSLGLAYIGMSVELLKIIANQQISANTFFWCAMATGATGFMGLRAGTPPGLNRNLVTIELSIGFYIAITVAVICFVLAYVDERQRNK